ncbi:MAG: amidohydrolase, partial [bacterium]
MSARLESRRLRAVLFIALSLSSIFCSQSEKGQVLILHNADIWTVDEQNPHAEAVAIKDGRFIAVGSNEDVLKLRDENSPTIDVQGAFMMPGFNDNHVHFASAARFLEFNIMKASSQEEFVERVRDVVGTLPKGDWLLGGLWGAYDAWAEGSAGGQSRVPFTPNVNLVEDITRDNPMFIRKFDNSEFAVNRAALKTLGLTPTSPSELPGIDFVFKQGEFTGILRGPGVLAYVNPKIPDNFSHERRLAQTRNALAEIRKYGVTNISDMSDDEQLQIYRELRESGELTVRVHYRYMLDRWPELAEKGIKVGSGDEWIRLGSLKGHIDGIMGNSSARFFAPYTSDPGNRGRWRRLMVDDDGNFVEGKFLQYMLDADAAGQQLTVHAIGDEANHLLLN